MRSIGIFFGGASSEYPISLQSSHAVISHLGGIDAELILIGITREGEWFRYYGDIAHIADDTWHKAGCVPAVVSPDKTVHGILEFSEDGIIKTRLDLAFPILHGKNGEDGTLQGLLELAGIPVIGCGTLSSALCMDKHRAHIAAEHAGIRAPKAHVITPETTAETILSIAEGIGYPLFVKPVRAGSSFGISKVRRDSELLDAVNLAFQHDSYVMMEENIEGFEVGCAVMGNDTLTIGEVDEIELQDGFFDFKEKYTLETSRIYMPARIPAEAAERVKKAAAVIYKALGCQGFARVDMFLTPAGEIVFNEVNTIPGFTAHSRFPNMMMGIGYTFEGVLSELISIAEQKAPVSVPV